MAKGQLFYTNEINQIMLVLLLTSFLLQTVFLKFGFTPLNKLGSRLVSQTIHYSANVNEINICMNMEKCSQLDGVFQIDVWKPAGKNEKH